MKSAIRPHRGIRAQARVARSAAVVVGVMLAVSCSVGRRQTLVVEGTLEWIVIDDFARGVSRTDAFVISDRGERYALLLSEEPKGLSSGLRVRVTGEQAGPGKLRVEPGKGLIEVLPSTAP